MSLKRGGEFKVKNQEAQYFDLNEGEDTLASKQFQGINLHSTRIYSITLSDPPEQMTKEKRNKLKLSTGGISTSSTRPTKGNKKGK